MVACSHERGGPIQKRRTISLNRDTGVRRLQRHPRFNLRLILGLVAKYLLFARGAKALTRRRRNGLGPTPKLHQTTGKALWDIDLVVPRAGIEPARLAAGDFESPASTNFTTWAGVRSPSGVAA